jgi:VCBS repeat-containing protein
VASISETTTGDVLANDPVPAGTLVTEVNGVAVNSSGTTTIQGEYGTLTINSSGQYTYTLRSGVGADHISTPDTFVYTVTAPDGSKDTASLNITPTAQAMNAVNDVSAVMDLTSVHHTSATPIPPWVGQLDDGPALVNPGQRQRNLRGRPEHRAAQRVAAL